MDRGTCCCDSPQGLIHDPEAATATHTHTPSVPLRGAERQESGLHLKHGEGPPAPLGNDLGSCGFSTNLEVEGRDLMAGSLVLELGGPSGALHAYDQELPVPCEGRSPLLVFLHLCSESHWPEERDGHFPPVLL